MRLVLAFLAMCFLQIAPALSASTAAPVLSTLTGNEYVRVESGGKIYDVPLATFSTYLKPAQAFVYPTPAFTDTFATDTPSRWITFDGSNFPPLASTPGWWMRNYYYGWPTNTCVYPNIGCNAARMETSQGPGGNNEAESYEDAQDAITPAGLTLTAIRSTANHGQCPWSSGEISSNINTGFGPYGYFEVVTKLPGIAGFWPAMALYSTDRVWPPEIDWPETPTLDANNVFSTTALHYNAIDISGQGKGGWTTVADTTAHFHKYGILVTASTVTFFYDDQPAGVPEPTPSSLATRKLYMAIGLAVGGPGSWPGQPAASVNTAVMTVRSASYYAPGSWGNTAIPLTPPAPAS